MGTDKAKHWSVSIPYCIKKKTNMYTFKNDLIKDINLLQIELDNDPLQYKPRKINSFKVWARTNKKIWNTGNILRTKCTWTEVGEQNSRFFLNLEKKTIAIN